MSPKTPAQPDAARTLAAWQRFIATGEIPAGELREHIFRAWTRAHQEGCSPQMMKAENLSDADTQALLARKRDLLEAARPYMVALSRAAGQERHAAMLADEDCVLLDVVGDEATVHDPNFPMPGARMSEGLAGANGLGTPLAEGRYIELEGPEHFISGFHAFTCQGTPLWEAGGQVVGVLSTSVRRPDASRRLREILLCAAHGIEAELVRRRLEQHVERAVGTGLSELALEQLRQDIVQTQAAARLRIEAAALRVVKAQAEQTSGLLQAASQAIATFRRRAALWQELATSDVGPIQVLDIGPRLAELIDLLKTEAAVREIRLTAEEPLAARALVDVRDFTRRAFRGLLESCDFAEAGGAVVITAAHLPATNEVLLRFVARPGDAAPRAARSSPGPHLTVDQRYPAARAAS